MTACTMCGDPAKLLVVHPPEGLDTLCGDCWQRRMRGANTRLIDPANPAASVPLETLKLIGLALIDAQLDDDERRQLDVMPGAFAIDLVNLVVPLVKIATAMLRTLTGWDVEAAHRGIDQLRQVVLFGEGLE